jgi:hypothetical protein
MKTKIPITREHIIFNDSAKSQPLHKYSERRLNKGFFLVSRRSTYGTGPCFSFYIYCIPTVLP